MSIRKEPSSEVWVIKYYCYNNKQMRDYEYGSSEKWAKSMSKELGKLRHVTEVTYEKVQN
jgi:hypothetical protein